MIKGFYGIVNVTPGCIDPVRVAASMCRGGCRVIQLRYKGAVHGEFLKIAFELRGITKSFKVLFIVNDDVSVAIESGADGFQTGQGDISCTEARKILGAGKLIGVSTHNLAQLENAFKDGADYAGFGPVFSTSTKQKPDPVTGVDGLAAAVKAARLPVVAIGGITLQNAGGVVTTGVDALASIDAVYRSGDVESVARQLNALFENHHRQGVRYGNRQA